MPIPIKIDEGELALLKQAKEEKDWTILPTWKLRYLYQRYIALPVDDLVSVREIANLAKEERIKKLELEISISDNLFSEAQEIFK